MVTESCKGYDSCYNRFTNLVVGRVGKSKPSFGTVLPSSMPSWLSNDVGLSRANYEYFWHANDRSFKIFIGMKWLSNHKDTPYSPTPVILSFR